MGSRSRAVLWVAASAGLAGWAGGCGGESEPAPAPSTEELLTSVCEKQAAAPCATAETKDQCLAELHQNVGYATQEGCEAELDAFLECASTGQVTCSSGYDGEMFPHFDEACYPLSDAFFECYTKLPGNCAVGLGVPGYADVACTIKCPTLSSLCHGPDANGPVECTCDSGPRAGAKFQATDCSMSLIWATGHNCT